MLLPTVAIVAPGSMGSSVAQCLTANGLTVLTSLTGRSRASEKRAQSAGMTPVSDAQLGEADFLLSIIPPGESLMLADRLAGVLNASNKKPIYVECNAISPATMRDVADIIDKTGCAFVGACIIGPPPQPGTTTTKFYAAGSAAAEFTSLNAFGLNVRVLDGPFTAASALKMSYAGITKGFTALGAAMMLAATRGGSAAALKAELAESQPALLAYLMRQVPGMYGKAYRWVAELDEIADFVGDERPEQAMLESAARFFDAMAQDFAGEKAEIGELEKFLK